MKVKKFDIFLNESLRDKMTPKTDEEKLLKGLYNDMLKKAYSVGFLGGIKKALELGADFDQLSLSNACSSGYSDIVEFMVKSGEDVNKHDGWFTPLGRAIQGGHLDTVKKLVDLGANTDYVTRLRRGPVGSPYPDYKSFTMVELAEHFKKPEIVEYLKSIKE
jgi:ankyrin repeat protein